MASLTQVQSENAGTADICLTGVQQGTKRCQEVPRGAKAVKRCNGSQEVPRGAEAAELRRQMAELRPALADKAAFTSKLLKPWPPNLNSQECQYSTRQRFRVEPRP